MNENPEDKVIEKINQLERRIPEDYFAVVGRNDSDFGLYVPPLALSSPLQPDVAGHVDNLIAAFQAASDAFEGFNVSDNAARQMQEMIALLDALELTEPASSTLSGTPIISSLLSAICDLFTFPTTVNLSEMFTQLFTFDEGEPEGGRGHTSDLCIIDEAYEWMNHGEEADG